MIAVQQLSFDPKWSHLPSEQHGFLSAPRHEVCQNLGRQDAMASERKPSNGPVSTWQN